MTTRSEAVAAFTNAEGRRNISLVKEGILKADGTTYLTWARRNRLTETTPLAWTDPDVEPEAGQTSVVELYALDDDNNLIGSVLPHGPFYSQDVGGAATSFDYDRETIPPPAGTRSIVFAIHAKRDGHWSWTAGAVGITIPDLSISGVPILSAVKGAAYAGFTATAGYGTPPYTYSLVGAWPAGISINSTTGAVSGTPTVNGSFAGLSVRVTDAVSDTADLPSFELAIAKQSFPRVVSTVTSRQNTSVSTSNVTLPAGIQAGDLLLMLFRHRGANTQATTPSGWTLLVGGTGGGSTALFYKIADGSEGATVAISHLVGASCAITHRIDRFSGLPEAVISATGVIDPPALSTSWGAKETLFFAMLATNLDQVATAIPSGYGNLIEEKTTGASVCSVHSTWRELLASSDDPSSFTVGATTAARAITVAVRPTA